MNAHRPVVLAVAGDPGGAAAVGPVIEALRSESRVDVAAMAYGHAATSWAPRRIAHEVLERIDEAEVEGLLRSARAGALLLGTSMNELNLERMFTRVARRLGVPSVAVLDMWSNYSARFGAVEGAGEDVPDRVAVMDDRARRAMLLEGFRPERVIVTGHPGFDDLIDARRRFLPEDRRRVRRVLQVTEAERMILFASQPLALTWGEDVTVPGHAGYTERGVLDATLASLDRLAPELQEPLTLVVRPHPREVTMAPPGGDRPYRVLVSRDETSRNVAMASDAVLGMCTVLLVESALLGIPTLSIQPGLHIPDALPAIPDLARVYRTEELDGALGKILRVVSDQDAALATRSLGSGVSPPPEADARLIAPGSAAHGVMRILHELLGATG